MHSISYKLLYKVVNFNVHSRLSLQKLRYLLVIVYNVTLKRIYSKFIFYLTFWR